MIAFAIQVGASVLFHHRLSEGEAVNGFLELMYLSLPVHMNLSQDAECPVSTDRPMPHVRFAAGWHWVPHAHREDSLCCVGEVA
jgi:hypothetical protein